MSLALSVGLLEFSIIIAEVLSQNNFVGPSIDNTISSRMEEIYFEAWALENVAINPASVELLDTVACSLLL